MADTRTDPIRNSRRTQLIVAITMAVVVLIGLSVGRASVSFGTDAAAADTAQLGDIYRLEAAFHRAKTTQDIDLMMSLWADGATLNSQGDPKSP